jgi:hypothetical protein
LREGDRKALLGESTGHSSLERRPVVDFGDMLVLSLPHAVSPAVRRFVLSELRQLGYLQAFSDALANRQARQVEHEGLWELKNEAVSLEPPGAEDGPMPTLCQWES